MAVEMAKLIYSAIASLDGYVEDAQGKFDWAAPDDEVHAFVNDLERPIGTYLYGRRMYETMVFWETVSTSADQPAVTRDFAQIWRAAERSCTPARFRRCRARGRGSIASLTLRRSRGSRIPRTATSRLAVPNSLARRSPQAWSTSANSSSPRSSSAGEACTAGLRSRPARAFGRAPLPKRCRLPALPHTGLTGWATAELGGGAGPGRTGRRWLAWLDRRGHQRGNRTRALGRRPSRRPGRPCPPSTPTATGTTVRFASRMTGPGRLARPLPDTPTGRLR
jgi:hypothetical protein